MTTHDELAELRDRVTGNADDIVQRHHDGELTRDEAADDAAIVAVLGASLAAQIAALGFDRQLVAAGGDPSKLDPPAPDIDGQHRKLTTTARGALAGNPTEQSQQLGRMVRIETMRGHGDTQQWLADNDEQVAGWTREAEPDACPLCSEFDGVPATGGTMYRHDGCACVQKPNLKLGRRQ